MPKKSPVINIFTYGLPFILANQIYNEYQDRLREAKYIIEISDKYAPLGNNLKTVELLLALSIFHKRVVSNLDAAVKFHGTVSKVSQANTIRMGNYDFTGEEKNRLLALTISYRKLLNKYEISEAVMNYNLTKEFLQKLLVLKSISEDGEE